MTHMWLRRPLHKNKTIMCHVIKRKPTSVSFPLKVNMDTHSAELSSFSSFLLTCGCLYGIFMILTRTVLR